MEHIVRVADLSYSEKIRRAIEYSDVLNEILEEVGDINALVTQMVVVSGGLIALAATGYGAVAAFSGTDFLKGIAGLVKFFTTVDDAKSEEDLKTCGKLFGDAVAKIGVNGLFFVMSMFGLKKASARLTAKTIADSNPNSGKWNWKRIEKTREKIIIEQYNVQNKCVGNTNIFIENFSSEDVPSVANGRFNDFFNSLTVDEIDFFWNKPDIKSSIESRLRSPGGLHEWHLVSRAPTFKYWGISAETIKELRTSIIDVEFINPKGTHGGRGSTMDHNELLQIIDSSTNYDTFVRRLNNWANYRLKGGNKTLPKGLQINCEEIK